MKKALTQLKKNVNKVYLEMDTLIGTFHAKLKVVILNKWKKLLLNSKAVKDLNSYDTIKSYNNLDDDIAIKHI